MLADEERSLHGDVGLDGRRDRAPNDAHPTMYPGRTAEVIAAEDLEDSDHDMRSLDKNGRVARDVVHDEDVQDISENDALESKVLLLKSVYESPRPYDEPEDDVTNNDSLAEILPKAPSRFKKQARLQRLEEKSSDFKDSGATMSEKPSPTSTVPVSDASSENEVKWLLYAAEILGRWGDRMWAFTSALFLLELFPGTMLLPAVYGLVVGLCVILLGALIGEWVDRTPRLAAVRLSLMTQNSCVALAALVLTFALLYKDSMPDSGKIWCVVGFLLFAVLADCGRVVSKCSFCMQSSNQLYQERQIELTVLSNSGYEHYC
ncbi:hypothetical protein RvY_13086-2 [Ramazzottius varieornatus]|uniref:Solute carrier family 40 member n=1 Tax=Ramazzottius varieornatus TaxID=947166 RepID=A0A1D1VVA1_RAMVA|nr:hypothetical protein RvY_13086-2 [Ramazzottius varieornatus]